ncbi:MAG: hypothetical protein GYB68_18455 [Chloroflexi bacterium]|nr:hypothetical protein [Chloroflexota bacterium]
MNISNLVILTIGYTLALLALNRTEKKRRWMTAVFVVLPLGFLTYRWAIFFGFVAETLIAAGLSFAVFLLFLVIYGWRNPPLDSSEAIKVIGQDDD